MSLQEAGQKRGWQDMGTMGAKGSLRDQGSGCRAEPVGTNLSPQQVARLPQRQECSGLSHTLSFVMTFSGLMLIGREGGTGNRHHRRPNLGQASFSSQTILKQTPDISSLSINTQHDSRKVTAIL